MLKRITVLFIVMIIVGCSSAQQEQDNVDSEKTVNSNIQVLNEEILGENLEIPWSITKASDTFYITERGGSIVRVSNGQVDRESVNLSEPVLSIGEGGLLGLELHHDFENNKLAFIYHTYGTEKDVKNRVVLVEKTENGWQERNVLLDNIKGARIHNGGRMKIGADNKLYVTTGDASDTSLSQERDDLAGSILRMNLDGSVPNDNPFPSSYVYSYGHRNPQGLAWDVSNNIMYASEHGPSGRDEINIIEAGKNYGWPIITGDEEQESMVSPLFHSGSDTWAPSGMAYRDGVLYVAGLRGNNVYAFDLEKKTVHELWNGVGRIRDIRLSEKGLYIITNNTDGRGVLSPGDDKLIHLELVKSTES
ncbi:PQQ-dependent sugar dehydrogenase [Bacillus alkalisoli]|uniref:PQQ-dependent sugar dehydrogenase n=1 Tax=Bacillus alkalisoli TaxID=2011008 RepID=UPI000C241FD3|nr:PQQ-dependent sugar dehydrogenase [Bacillus alkalisoli]